MSLRAAGSGKDGLLNSFVGRHKSVGRNKQSAVPATAIVQYPRQRRGRSKRGKHLCASRLLQPHVVFLGAGSGSRRRGRFRRGAIVRVQIDAHQKQRLQSLCEFRWKLGQSRPVGRADADQVVRLSLVFSPIACRGAGRHVSAAQSANVGKSVARITQPRTEKGADKGRSQMFSLSLIVAVRSRAIEAPRASALEFRLEAAELLEFRPRTDVLRWDIGTPRLRLVGRE